MQSEAGKLREGSENDSRAAGSDEELLENWEANRVHWHGSSNDFAACVSRQATGSLQEAEDTETQE